MSLATALTKKVDAILKRYATPSAKVYKRVVTRTGGDALIGQAVTVTNTDTLLVPQPMYARGMRRQVGGKDADDIATNWNGTVVAQSYETIFSSTAITISDLENPDVLFAFKDSLGNTEVYRVEDYEPIGLNSQVVSWLAYLTSMSR